jgi:toxin HigB-1
MIESFRDSWLEAFFEQDEYDRRIPSNLSTSLFRRLQMLDDAMTDADLRVPQGNRFEKLSGNLAGLHSIRVNQQWRLIFEWDGNRGVAVGVYLDDHSYR